jgi:hypothetical protein
VVAILSKAMVLSPLLFQIFVGLTSGLYVVTIVIYFLKRNRFPVAQRMPYLVLCEFALFAVAALENLLVGAFPDTSFFPSCKVYLLGGAIFENSPMALASYRVMWICVKNLVTQKLVDENRRVSVSERSNTVSKGLRRVMFLMLRYIDARLIPFLLILPTVVLSVFEVYAIWIFEEPNVSIFSEKCTAAVLSIITTLKLAAILPICVLGILAVIGMKDHFGLAKEVRGLLVVLSIFMLLIAASKNKNVYVTVNPETRVFFFLTGGILLPAEFVIQGIYPIYLSILNDRKQTKLNVGLISTGRKLSSSASSASYGSGEKMASRITLNDKNRTVADNTQDLLEMIRDPTGRDMILMFLQKEMSVENLLFLEAVDKLRSQASGPEDCVLCSRKKFVQEIVDQFISNTAPNQVNLSQAVRAPLMKKLNEHAKSLEADNQTHLLASDPFEKAYMEILLMMTSDSFSRFRMTSEYENFHFKGSRTMLTIELPPIDE